MSMLIPGPRPYLCAASEGSEFDRPRSFAAPEQSRGDEHGGYVLLVEDDADLRDTLSDILTFEGFRVATAAHGKAALEYLRRNPAPALILLDLMMPVMSGWEFRSTQLQDEQLARIPVVLVSAADDAEQSAVLLQTAGRLRKPLELDLVLSTVRHYCG